LLLPFNNTTINWLTTNNGSESGEKGEENNNAFFNFSVGWQACRPGFYAQLMVELLNDDPRAFHNFKGMPHLAPVNYRDMRYAHTTPSARLFEKSVTP